ncbi:MAG: hypothetical protein K0Q90_2367 [Paenibacillaceae bacterium]|jgi:rhamnogalacturonyl hydrolase YesR|nr:hypothetical protein [Paenibacillaceae bacterium]
MPHYVEEEESIAFRCGTEATQVLETIASRYIGDHPAMPFVFRAFNRTGFRQLADGRYDLNLGEKHPDARRGQYAYAFCKVWSGKEAFWETAVSCYGPVRVFVNGRLLYRSEAVDELTPGARKPLRVPLQAGWNTVLVTAVKTASGFGCILGIVRSKWPSPVILAPFAERAGQAGWIYSGLADQDVFRDMEIPAAASNETFSGVKWYPGRQWSAPEQSYGAGKRLFGRGEAGLAAYAWTRVECKEPGEGRYRLTLECAGAAVVWVDGVQHMAMDTGGAAEQELALGYGSHEVLVKFQPGAEDWGFRLELAGKRGICRCLQPHPIHGTQEPWLYLGPLPADHLPFPDGPTLTGLWGQENGGIYWRTDEPDVWVRAYPENENYARWSYPLGVTLYGILRAGRMLERPDLVFYAVRHVRACTGMYAYSLWEAEHYGFPSVNHQLADMDMLDDCGSFASAMLEVYAEAPDPASPDIAREVADFMMNRLERKADGAFYRKSPGYYMENTLWGDDLYMSIPFLIRYARLTGESSYLDEAAKQFLLFRRYLYMPEERIMSHVYDFKQGMATMVPWGRGNGWPAFTLSELLEALPAGHPQRQELLGFFNEFCSGLLGLQGSGGLWHQVLTDPESYEETSCTAMFVYAFCRGVRLGLLEDPEPYMEAALRGWAGLTRHAVDQWGNVYGVCRGSKYSFSPDYYKYDLTWSLNDTHGIGIVLLAGVEVAAMLGVGELRKKREQGVEQ